MENSKQRQFKFVFLVMTMVVLALIIFEGLVQNGHKLIEIEHLQTFHSEHGKCGNLSLKRFRDGVCGDRSLIRTITTISDTLCGAYTTTHGVFG
jgi:hypothetical protein